MSFQVIRATQFNIPEVLDTYQGKVRDLYFLEDRMVIVATDRISAFDHILPRGIMFKGQILNKIAAHMLKNTVDIVPNWLEAVPHSNVSIGKRCEPIKLEMVVRKYLTGHAWRTYKAGKRSLCGIELADGMRENQELENAIITPATKAEEGHDEDISEKEIVDQGILSQALFNQIKDYSFRLFARGTEMAAKRGLILVDTKYEFGIYGDQILLIDEIHTPDSSRYFYADCYKECFEKGKSQNHLSKEFVREWLVSMGFQGKEGQKMPEMTDQVVDSISKKYIELYSILIGEEFMPSPTSEIEESIVSYLSHGIHSS